MSAFVSCVVMIMVAMTLLWLVSLRLRNAGIVDSVWGLGFVAIAAITTFSARPLDAARLLPLALVSIWGIRLAVHISWRNHGKGEDPRYAEMRSDHGDAFAWRSLWIVFWFQGALMLVISAPLQMALMTPRGSIEPWQWAGVLVWLVGFLFETIGDWQLVRFKADPDNRGEVLDSGLWRYTRHPNYFGDAMVWWGLFAVCLPIGAAAWTAVGPLVMTVMLMRVSGVTLLEKSLKESKPGYAEYVRKTSAFLPLPPQD